MSVYDKSIPMEQVRKVRGDILTDIGGDNPFLDKAKAERYKQALTIAAKLAVLHHARYSGLSSGGNNRKDFGDAISGMISKFVQTGEMPILNQLDETQEKVAGPIAVILKSYALKASYPSEAPPGVKTNYDGVLRQYGLNEYATDENAVDARRFAEHILFGATEQLAREQIAQSAPPSVSRA